MKKASLLALIATVSYLLVAFGFYLGRSNNAASFRIHPQSNISTTDIDIGMININEDDLQTLMLLDEIGETLARRILIYRWENGPFQNIEELLLVDGITESKLERIRDYITVGDGT